MRIVTPKRGTMVLSIGCVSGQLNDNAPVEIEGHPLQWVAFSLPL